MFHVRWYNSWQRCSMLDGRMGGRYVLCEMVRWVAEMFCVRWYDGWLRCSMLGGKMGG